jgi:beta-xylosidase
MVFDVKKKVNNWKQSRELLIENDIEFNEIARDKIVKFLLDLSETGFIPEEIEQILETGIALNIDYIESRKHNEGMN